MAADISEQPEVYAGLIDNGMSEISAVAAAIAERRPRSIVFTARGTSDHAALYGAYLSEIRLGIPAGLASPSVVTVFDARPDWKDSLVIAVSQSGGSPDLAAVVKAARESGAMTLAITNNPNSPLAAEAEFHIDVRAGHERAVAATKTYTAELLALFLLFEGIRTGDGKLEGTETGLLSKLPELASDVLTHSTAPDLAGRYRFAERFVTTGRGYAYPTARETALKLMETSYLPSLAFSGADLLHGPLAMADPGVPVLAVVGSGPGGKAMHDVLGRLENQRADIVIVGSYDLQGQTARMATPDIDERIASMLDILPLQQLALHLALQRGENPDAPRGLKKVTETV
ncbi:SIS domain-containing protein [Salininema proteolyticum]|uniref:SIS domain-containing protein n=1 Tax=Salininema proteolyticum TaxID=1607685 RepID=A0ABV8U2P7_9ACTN